MAAITRVTDLLFLVCVLCASSGESSLNVFPRNSDVNEGDSISLKCEGKRLSSEKSIEWQNPNNVTLTTMDRFVVECTDGSQRGDSLPTKKNDLTISPVMRRDSGIYRCLVVVEDTEQERLVVETVEVTVTVFAFPNDTECSGGPTTLRSGDVLSLRCESSPGYPRVNLTITSTNAEFRDEQWNTELRTDGGIVRSLDLEASLAHDGVIVSCNVTSSRFPLKTRHCILGPITVQPRPVTESLTTRLNRMMLSDPVESTTVHSIVHTTTLPVSDESFTEIISESSTSNFLPFHTPPKSGVSKGFLWLWATVSSTTLIVMVMVLVCKKITARGNAVGQIYPNT